MYKYEDLPPSERHLLRLLGKQSSVWCCNGYLAASRLSGKGLIEKTGVFDDNGCRYRLSTEGRLVLHGRTKKIFGRK